MKCGGDGEQPLAQIEKEQPGDQEAESRRDSHAYSPPPHGLSCPRSGELFQASRAKDTAFMLDAALAAVTAPAGGAAEGGFAILMQKAALPGQSVRQGWGSLCA